MAGHNERGFPAVYQVIDFRLAMVLPRAYGSVASALAVSAPSAVEAR
jgi:hypothetical protein